MTQTRLMQTPPYDAELERLRARLAQVEEESRRKDEFLAAVPHELHDALSPLRNSLHLLRLHGLYGGAGQALAAAERQFRQVARLVDELLDLAQMREGTLQLKPESVAVTDVVRRAVDAARSFVDNRRHRLDVVLPSQPVSLVADPGRLTQVLVNLLDNAARYTEPGGFIAVRADREEDEIVLSVRDTGAGIHPDVLPYLLDQPLGGRFRDHGPGGLGIGLKLARTFVELHEGRLEARSPGPGQGSEFIVRLPLRSGLIPQVQADVSVMQVERAQARSILVVDDNRDAAESLAVLMRLWGYKVHVALDGPAAVAAVPVHAPDLVLLDLGLPGMDGYEVAQRIRGQCASGDAPVFVALTGYGQESDLRRSREAGFRGHLLKPIDPVELLAFLTQHVPRTRS